MKAIAICGSPREAGNTEALLQTCLDTLARAGIEGELIRLADKTLEPCTACMQCLENKDKQCAIQDDFAPVFEKMEASDIIVLGSPVYFGSATANLTALMDRSGSVARWNGNLFSRKLGGPIVVARRAGVNFTYAQLIFWYTIADMIVAGSTYWNVGHGMDPGDIQQDEEAVDTVQRFAENLAWLAQKIEA